MTIAPYMINCVYDKGFVNGCIIKGICYIIFAITVLLAVFFNLRKNCSSVNLSSYHNSDNAFGAASKPRVEDYYGEIYHSNTANSDKNDI